MKIYDFSEQFMHYVEKWMQESAADFKTPDAMEAALPSVYLQFLNTEADWLDGKTPGAYFQSFEPNELVSYLCESENADISAPEPLTDRIAELGLECEDALIAVVKNADNCDSLRATAINLLREIASPRAAGMCIDLIEESDELREVAVDLLSELGQNEIENILNRLENTSESTKEAFLDVLCNFPGDERIYTYTVQQFLTQSDKRAMYASFLAKLNDERAIEPLTKALDLSDLDYIDYIEIRNAIEMLGGEVECDRDFTGDPSYEALGALETDK